ncbi:exported hypothetical protein [Verrucomicrobia bacterium]|nr:exported hypothetical protein [Verrucomicrobiota bacterium]
MKVERSCLPLLRALRVSVVHSSGPMILSLMVLSSRPPQPQFASIRVHSRLKTPLSFLGLLLWKNPISVHLRNQRFKSRPPSREPPIPCIPRIPWFSRSPI